MLKNYFQFDLQVKEALHHLGKLQGMDNTDALLEAHAKEMLDSLKGNYLEWGSFTVQRVIFETLLLEAGKADIYCLESQLFVMVV